MRTRAPRVTETEVSAALGGSGNALVVGHRARLATDEAGRAGGMKEPSREPTRDTWRPSTPLFHRQRAGFPAWLVSSWVLVPREGRPTQEGPRAGTQGRPDRHHLHTSAAPPDGPVDCRFPGPIPAATSPVGPGQPGAHSATADAASHYPCYRESTYQSPKRPSPWNTDHLAPGPVSVHLLSTPPRHSLPQWEMTQQRAGSRLSAAGREIPEEH